MKIPFTWIAIAILILALLGLYSAFMIQRDELKRTTSNQNNLLSENYVLELTNKEFKHSFDSQKKIIDSLGLKLSRVVFTTQVVTETKETIKTVFRDSIISGIDTVKCMQFTTPHLTISGCLDKTNHFEGFYQSVDTITQVIHRVPKFTILGMRFGTKGIEQSVVCSNPNATISYKNYIAFKK